jgi:RNA polymerase sigma-70 factor (ECF subfamily)
MEMRFMPGPYGRPVDPDDEMGEPSSSCEPARASIIRGRARCERPRVSGRTAVIGDARRAGEESALLAAVAAGDREAFAEIHRRYAGPIHAYALRRTGDRGAAEDLVQDVFVTVWRTARAYDARRAPVGAWITMIARNRMIDRLRRASVRPQPAVAEVHEAEFGTEPSFDGRVADSLAVADALATLPDHHRTAVELAFYDGLSYAEIAERTGTPLGTVKSRMLVALRQLAGELA